MVAAVLFIVVVCVAASRDTKASSSELSSLDLSSSPINSPVTSSPGVSTSEDLSMLPRRQFIVLDLETTGLDARIHEIIEFGAIRAELDSDVHKTFQALVKPTKKVPQRITEITGITQSMVDSEGRELNEVLKEFVEFIGELPLVTYNASFDMAFLQTAASQNGLSINNRYTCALKLARRAWPGLPSYRLADLAKMGNLPDDDTHRALGDCKRALIVFVSSASKQGKRIRWSRLLAEPHVEKTVAIN